MPPWHLHRMAALDFEASDKDPETARIVSCALIHVGGNKPTETLTWLVNPGVEQNPEAIKVHGLTDEYLAQHGIPADRAVAEILHVIGNITAEGVPLVGHNLGSYDLNLLDREARRHHQTGLEDAAGPLSRVIDTMVLDRHAAPYRRRVSDTQGPYQMRTTAETYGLKWEEDKAHGAAYDAHKSAQAAWMIGSIAHRPAAERPAWVHQLRNRRGPYDRFDDLTCDVDELHRRQILWHAEWAENFEAHLRKSDATTVIGREWPLRPTPAGVTA